jgi:hypothetical protein
MRYVLGCPGFESFVSSMIAALDLLIEKIKAEIMSGIKMKNYHTLDHDY